MLERILEKLVYGAIALMILGATAIGALLIISYLLMTPADKAKVANTMHCGFNKALICASTPEPR